MMFCMKPFTEKQIKRFWGYVEKTETCWLWIGYKTGRGYGAIEFNYKSYPAHRVSWYLAFGEMPTVYVLHKCNNPICVNPEHLFLGTQFDNMRDMVQKGRYRNLKFTDEDVYEVKKLLAEGYHYGYISKKFDMSFCTISDINTGRRRGDVIYP